MAVANELSNRLSILNTTSKYTLFGGLIVILVVFFGMLYFVFNKEYAVLFADLESSDASTILTELKKNKIDYKLADDGRKIMVDEDKVYETRLLIVNSIPALSGGVGFEIFDTDNFGTTEFAQKINYQRALQGELARTIMSLEEVKFARVHLVLPSSSIFKRKAGESRASVTLTLKKDRVLSDKQVAGIQRLVASSTPGMKSENVTILDQKGVTLVALENDEHNLGIASTKLKRKQEIEKYLTNKAQSVLDQTFGTKVAYVTIDVALDFNNIKKTREQVISPDGKDINIAHKKEIQMKGNKNQKADTSRSTIEVDYKLGKEIEEIISTPGSVERMSIAIITPNGLSNEQVEYIKSIVGNAVGYDSIRGDVIALSSMMSSISTTHEKQSSPKLSTSPQDVSVQKNFPEKYNSEYLNWMTGTVQKVLGLMTNSPIVTFLALVLFLLFFIYLLLAKVFGGGKKYVKENASDGLSDEERTRLLSEIKTWLAADRI